MRISDWSSDVCSSDLIVSVAERPQNGQVIVDSVITTGAPFLPLHQPDQVIVDRRLIQHNEPSERSQCRPRTEDDIGPPSCPSQIGRASCRERVCQYV